MGGIQASDPKIEHRPQHRYYEPTPTRTPGCSRRGYADPTQNVTGIAWKLGVSFIGEGTVRRAGSVVRITFQLIALEIREKTGGTR